MIYLKSLFVGALAASTKFVAGYDNRDEHDREHEDEHDQEEQERQEREREEACNRNPNARECDPYWGMPTGSPTYYPTMFYDHSLADFGESKLYSPDSVTDDYYGFATAVWEETVLVGAYATVAFGSFTGQVTGSVFVYENHDRFAARLLVHAADMTYFGYSVAVWNDRAVIGAPRTDFDHCDDCGCSYVFRRYANGSWILEDTLIAEDFDDYHYVGYSNSIYEDTVFVGAPGDKEHGDNTGAVYVFINGADGWTFTQKLSITNDNEHREEKHRGEEFDHFGSAVATNGNFAVIGAYGDDKNTGAVYCYTQVGFWAALSRLTASDGAEGIFFGYSVALGGDTIVVGAYNGDGHWYGAGAAYVYKIINGNNFAASNKLVAHDGMTSDYFGFSVAIFQNVIVVGAHGEEGKGHEREKDDHKHRKLPGGGGGEGGEGPGEGHQREEGENCGPNSPPDCQQFQGMYSYRGTGAGAAYVFRRTGDFWGQTMKVIPAYSEAYDHFGVSVATYNEEIIVGADTADGVVDDTGAAYVYFPKFSTDWDRDRQKTAEPAPVSDSDSSFFANLFGGNGDASATFAFVVVLVPVALGVAWWFVSSGKSSSHTSSKDGLMQLPQDSRHGATVPWSMHGAFDESSWGLESSHSVTNTRSPLRGPANVASR